MVQVFLYLYLVNNLNLHRSVSNAFKHLLSLDFTILNPYFIFSIFIKDVMAIVVGVLMFIFNVYFGLEVLGDHSWFYLPITYATRYVYMFIEGSIPITLTLAIYIIITLLLAVLLYKGFNKWSGRTIKD
ncbi:BsaG family lantibiotic immunity ABC transporter permease subunit [Staphylococcus aureus]|uniref:BsaG family lantibiotic immunity ABC transporter permease subunit n=1 Tax=Staphylococcus aureus TaxID=1280 RepID=UPI0037D9D131